jgi:hypothetical protein
MRLIVLVEWGPKRWTKAVLAPGERLRVGRHERAALCLPMDEEMSGLHCELRWDGTRGSVRDLGSANGTFVNGERVQEAEIQHGEWFQAGETILSVYIEGNVAPWAPPGGKARSSPENKAQVLAALQAEALPLYAVLDTARDERMGALLRCCAELAQSLYDGRKGEELESVAPFLVALPKESWLLARLVHEGWGARWGIYLTCQRPFKEVRRHLRRHLLVNVKERAEQLYFRFYDPRVMRAAFAMANSARTAELLGDVQSFLVEGDAAELVRLRAEPALP